MSISFLQIYSFYLKIIPNFEGYLVQFAVMSRVKFVITLLLLPTYLSAAAQSLSLGWQQGDVLVRTSFDNKGKIEQVESSTIEKIDTNNDKTVYTISTTATDGNGNPININTKEKSNSLVHEIVSTNDYLLFADMASLFKNAPIPEDKELTITTSGELPTIPRNPQVGALPDASYCITMSNGKMDINLKFNYSKRKVVGQEVIKTECGEFVCWKFTDKMTFSMLLFKKNFLCTTWIADNIGIVKQEIADNSGKLISRECLTQFNVANR